MNSTRDAVRGAGVAKRCVVLYRLVVVWNVIEEECRSLMLS